MKSFCKSSCEVKKCGTVCYEVIVIKYLACRVMTLLISDYICFANGWWRSTAVCLHCAILGVPRHHPLTKHKQKYFRWWHGTPSLAQYKQTAVPRHHQFPKRMQSEINGAITRDAKYLMTITSLQTVSHFFTSQTYLKNDFILRDKKELGTKWPL